MKVSFLLFPLLALLWGGTSCTPQASNARIQAIDSLTQQLADAKAEFLKIDTTDVANMHKITRNDLEYIRNYYADTVNHPVDSIGLEAMLVISDHRSVMKSTGQWMEEYRVRQTEYARREINLKDLRHDVENGIISDSLYEAGFNSEAKVVKHQVDANPRLVEWANRANRRYEHKKVEIDSLKQSIYAKWPDAGDPNQ